MPKVFNGEEIEVRVAPGSQYAAEPGGEWLDPFSSQSGIAFGDMIVSEAWLPPGGGAHIIALRTSRACTADVARHLMNTLGGNHPTTTVAIGGRVVEFQELEPGIGLYYYASGSCDLYQFTVGSPDELAHLLRQLP